mgnify:CR=1 FL=1
MRDVNIYLSLRKQVGWIKLDENQAQSTPEKSDAGSGYALPRTLLFGLDVTF